MDSHVDGRWCDDLRCSRCYSADSWRKHDLAIRELEIKASNLRGSYDWACENLITTLGMYSHEQRPLEYYVGQVIDKQEYLERRIDSLEAKARELLDVLKRPITDRLANLTVAEEALRAELDKYK